ncbi:MAG: acetyl-CoA carboxylase carboxyltransferase subunit beta [Phycisphaerales bacterium]|nr:acetyl-CoA carboxylase carboxyltransferase subunit beta [Phycisphaerales bacterium]MCB9856391.1 acetyl-CoA carboxylase carboxyltransferase subunit beta [Phycisphaerales bacterium]MCB9864522.1 acetyl-CoA carboxylase carboxyltransferase subunit beta [Phycisphaerales bacterium]
MPKVEVPEGVWLRCDGCSQMIFKKVLEENLRVCPLCGHHYRVDARTRAMQLCDTDTFEEFNAELVSTDPLEWTDSKAYTERQEEARKRTGLTEAVITGKAYIKGRPAILAVMDPFFIMGSMGAVVGEKVTAAIERATDDSLPVVIVTCSGGARMQEGLVSLMQMAKTSAAIARHDDAKGLYITVLTDPTTAGVAASFASLGDIALAEPKAMIGFAGPRVIWNTVKTELPEGFQTAEFMLEHGYVDRIVPRSELRNEIARIIDYCGR